MESLKIIIIKKIKHVMQGEYFMVAIIKHLTINIYKWDIVARGYKKLLHLDKYKTKWLDN